MHNLNLFIAAAIHMHNLNLFIKQIISYSKLMLTHL